MMRYLLLGTLLLVPTTAAQEPVHEPTPDTVPRSETAVAIIERRLGVQFSILGSKIRRRMISTDTPYGFAVRRVTPGSLAAKRGVAPSWIVMQVDGKPLREISQLAAVLRAKEAGEVVKLQCSRRKQRRRLFDRKPWENVPLELKLNTPISPKPATEAKATTPDQKSPRKNKKRIL